MVANQDDSRSQRINNRTSVTISLTAAKAAGTKI